VGYENLPDKVANKGYTLEFYHVPSDKSVTFLAMLADYSDSFKSEWKKEKVYGRNDAVQTFEGTEREITLAWEVPSADITEAKKNMAKFAMLAKMLYPTYEISNNAATIMASPLLKLKFANLIHDLSRSIRTPATSRAKYCGLLGKAAGFKYAPVIEDGFFDKDAGELYPQTMKLDCVFTVLHQHPVGWSPEGKFISNWNGSFPFWNKEDESAPPTLTVSSNVNSDENIFTVDTEQEQSIAEREESRIENIFEDRK